MGYDAGKKIKGRKRHALDDTDGRPLVLETRPADKQDGDGGGTVLAASRHAFPYNAKVFADSGYAGKRVDGDTDNDDEIVRKNDDQVGFAVQPRRWVVERFFAWIGSNAAAPNISPTQTPNRTRSLTYDLILCRSRLSAPP